MKKIYVPMIFLIFGAMSVDAMVSRLGSRMPSLGYAAQRVGGRFTSSQLPGAMRRQLSTKGTLLLPKTSRASLSPQFRKLPLSQQFRGMAVKKGVVDISQWAGQNVRSVGRSALDALKKHKMAIGSVLTGIGGTAYLKSRLGSISAEEEWTPTLPRVSSESEEALRNVLRNFVGGSPKGNFYTMLEALNIYYDGVLLWNRLFNDSDAMSSLRDNLDDQGKRQLLGYLKSHQEDKSKKLQGQIMRDSMSGRGYHTEANATLTRLSNDYVYFPLQLRPKHYKAEEIEKLINQVISTKGALNREKISDVLKKDPAAFLDTRFSNPLISYVFEEDSFRPDPKSNNVDAQLLTRLMYLYPQKFDYEQLTKSPSGVLPWVHEMPKMYHELTGHTVSSWTNLWGYAPWA